MIGDPALKIVGFVSFCGTENAIGKSRRSFDRGFGSQHISQMLRCDDHIRANFILTRQPFLR